ncbi:MAG TPA: glutamate formimidoyltransferase [Chthonomonas sp.]|uniref:glutamate formimidoyltransferase n=1 Tax=Chthonomonas sp. TaxID=2282153 RepID=UPI002B4B2294|nr:glutamate formimidoyltransferase [Chthonomonas sp.]HLI48233.1 glutamate formimidoyltransferase [Chthonomonas sp.]
MARLIGSVFQCVPNFSEGRRREVVEAIAAAAQNAGAVVADWSLDPDHNRSVVTLLGDAQQIEAGIIAAAEVAIERIDMRQHHGLHPRTGALDVLPVVPLRNATKEEAVALAHRLGERLAHSFNLPVFFYEWAARPGRETELPKLRRGGWERLAQGALDPDVGPQHAHPTAGVAIVGARGPLIAYNILLNTADAAVARELARQIRRQREQIAELEGVRAMGLFLPSRGLAQLSMNLTRPEKTPLPGVFEWVKQAAQAQGAAPLESEIVGLIPMSALGEAKPEDILWHGYRPEKLLEWWLGAQIL